MGFPAFNIILGLIAGYYFGKRISFMKMKSEMQPQIINKVSLFAGLIMALFCTSTGIIALSDEYTGNAVKGILGLGFEVTKAMILVIVIVGGVGFNCRLNTLLQN